MSRALSPRTVAAYQNVLKLAFPQHGLTFQEPSFESLDTRKISTWGNSALNQLKCAIRWWRKANAYPATLEPQLEEALAPRYVVSKQVYTPSEFEMEQLEKAANSSSPPTRAAVLLMLYLGLRVEEFYTLSRRTVERAAASHLMTFVRKGGAEASLDVTRVTGLLDDLLLMPARAPKGFVPVRPKKWERVGEIYSSGKKHAQYHVIRRMVRDTFAAAGLDKASPHKLRHAFATRMLRDGASPFIIQAALNHKNITTTQRYVHAGSADVAKYMRGPGEKK